MVTGMVILMQTCVATKGFIIQQVITECNWNITLLGFSIEHAPQNYLALVVKMLGYLYPHPSDMAEGCFQGFNSLGLLSCRSSVKVGSGGLRLPLCKEMLVLAIRGQAVGYGNGICLG